MCAGVYMWCVGSGVLEPLKYANTNVQVTGQPPKGRSGHTFNTVGRRAFLFGGCGESTRINDRGDEVRVDASVASFW